MNTAPPRLMMVLTLDSQGIGQPVDLIQINRINTNLMFHQCGPSTVAAHAISISLLWYITPIHATVLLYPIYY